MASPDEFELLIKMNRLAPPSALSGPLPVKFREVHYNERFSGDELKKKQEDLQVLLRGDAESTALPPTEHRFFKDPLLPPDLALIEESRVEEEQMAPVKLGRNMRASHPQFGNLKATDVHGLRNERNKLLDQQKEQQSEFTKHTESKTKAAALVNDLLQQGFHITAPESTVQGCADQRDLCREMDGLDGKMRSGQSEDERLLVAAIQKEIKRVTGKDLVENSEEVS